jgi:hypothetical protein
MVTPSGCGIDPASVCVTVTIDLGLPPRLLLDKGDADSTARDAEAARCIGMDCTEQRRVAAADLRIVGMTTRVAARPMAV